MDNASRPPRKHIGQTGRFSRGVVWRSLTAGETLGKPFAEWAYLTPRFPNGIKLSDLKREASEIQRETARCWFLLNLKPYDLSGKVYFAVGVHGAGLDQAPLAPSPLSAAAVLDQEFNGVILPQVIAPLSNDLGNSWMWIDDPTTEPSQNVPIAIEDVISAFNHLARQLSELAPAYSGLGHNGPPEELPLSADEHAQALYDIKSVMSELAAGNLKAAKTIANRVWEVARKICFWALMTVSGVVLSETAKAALGYYGYSIHVQQLLLNYAP